MRLTLLLAFLFLALPAQAVELANTSWSAGRLRVSFGNGQVSVSGGCNHLGAPYELRGAAIRFGSAASTLMGCAPELMEADRRAAEALKAIRRVELQGDVLRLLDESGKAVWTLRRVR